MKKVPGNLSYLGLPALACVGMAILALPTMASAQSAEPPVPATMAAQGQPTANSLIVTNKPIFAPPKAGSLLLSASPHPVGGSVVVSGVKRFRIVFPPASKAGSLSLFGPAATPQGGWKPLHWYEIHSLGAMVAKIGIQWQPSVGGMGAASAPTRAAEISVNSVIGAMQITASSALVAGGRGIGRGRAFLEQVVVDMRLENGRAERIQFLPVVPQERTVLLGPSTPAAISIRVPGSILAAGIVPRLSLAVGAFRARGGENFHLVGGGTSAYRRTRAVWINLLSVAQPAEKPVAGRLVRLGFSLGDGAVENNYAREIRLASLYMTRIRALLLSIAKERSGGVGGLGQEDRKAKRLLADIMVRNSRLRSLRLATLCIELYPGGPVVETVTYKTPSAAMRSEPQRPVATRPAEKKKHAAGF